ncbi:MAG: hypothetical protein ACK4MV_16605 [Beijerinckiaceae bacterium]
MTALNQNPPQPLVAGDSFSLSFALTITGAAPDFTGADVKWSVYADARTGPRLLEKTTGNGAALAETDGAWRLQVDVGPGETEALVGQFYHEATIWKDGEYRHTVATGTIEFRNSRNDEAAP